MGVAGLAVAAVTAYLGAWIYLDDAFDTNRAAMIAENEKTRAELLVISRGCTE